MARKKRLFGRKARTRGLSRAPVAKMAPGQPGVPDESEPDDARLQDAYERVVIAAGKVLYESPTHENVMQMIQSGEIHDGIAEAVSTVLLQLYEKSGGKMPGEVILPAAAEVIGMALELAQAAGVPGAEEADPQQIFKLLISKFIAKGAVDPEEAREFINSMDPGELEKMMAEQRPAAAGEPAPSPGDQQAPGMIASGMAQPEEMPA